MSKQVSCYIEAVFSNVNSSKEAHMERRLNDAPFKHVINMLRGPGRITCAQPISQNLVETALIDILSAGEIGREVTRCIASGTAALTTNSCRDPRKSISYNVIS